MSGLPIRDATRFLRLARQQYRLGPRPSPAREQTERDGPPPILTAARLGQLLAILDASVARRQAERERGR